MVLTAQTLNRLRVLTRGVASEVANTEDTPSTMASMNDEAGPTKSPKSLLDASQDDPPAKASMDQTGFDNSGLTQTAPPGRPPKPLGTSLDAVSAVQTPPPDRPPKPLGVSYDDVSAV